MCKREISSSQCALQRIAPAKDSSVHQGHVAVNILYSITSTAPNQGTSLCLCLVHVNMNMAYSFLLLIGGQTTCLGPLVFFKSRRKICVWLWIPSSENVPGFLLHVKVQTVLPGSCFFMYLSDTSIWSVFLDASPPYYFRLEELYSKLGLHPNGNLSVSVLRLQW